MEAQDGAQEATQMPTEEPCALVKGNFSEEEYTNLSEESEEEFEEEPTEEDLAFINDSKPEKADVDCAGIDESNIIRGSRKRRAPQRWEHPDAESVLNTFYKRSKITKKDLLEIASEEMEEDVASAGSLYTDESESSNQESGFETESSCSEESEFETQCSESCYSEGESEVEIENELSVKKRRKIQHSQE